MKEAGGLHFLHLSNFKETLHLMHSEFVYSKDYLELKTPSSFKDSNTLDHPWRLKKEEVSIIGLWKRMVGDDDSLILLFVDLNGNVYPMNTNYLSNFESVKAYLYREYDIPSLGDFTSATIIFPKEFHGEKLYKRHWGFDIKRELGNKHPGLGKLSRRIIEYLDIRKDRNPGFS